MIKKIDNEDLEYIIKTVKMLDPIDRQEVISRILFYKAGFKNCYVVKTENGEVAYIQWLIYPSENSIIKNSFGGMFNPLKNNEVMVENAFTFPKYRGFGFMQTVTFKLLQIAKEDGYKFVTIYVRKDRITALNENLRMGFKITKMITEYFIMGIRKRTL